MDFFIVSVILLKVNKDDCTASDIQAETFDGHADTFGCHADLSDCHVEAFEAIIICCFIFMGFIVMGSFL